VSDLIVPVEGLITRELLPYPSYLLRGRMHGASLTAPYGWVAVMTQTSPTECEIKGYLAKDRKMTPEEYSAIQRLGISLGYKQGHYGRFNVEGNLRKRKDISK